MSEGDDEFSNASVFGSDQDAEDEPPLKRMRPGTAGVPMDVVFVAADIDQNSMLRNVKARAELQRKARGFRILPSGLLLLGILTVLWTVSRPLSVEKSLSQRLACGGKLHACEYFLDYEIHYRTLLPNPVPFGIFSYKTLATCLNGFFSRQKKKGTDGLVYTSKKVSLTCKPNSHWLHKFKTCFDIKDADLFDVGL